jgi:hypothetical protein
LGGIPKFPGIEVMQMIRKGQVKGTTTSWEPVTAAALALVELCQQVRDEIAFSLCCVMNESVLS